MGPNLTLAQHRVNNSRPEFKSGNSSRSRLLGIRRQTQRKATGALPRRAGRGCWALRCPATRAQYLFVMFKHCFDETLK